MSLSAASGKATSLMARLKSETADAHARTEQAVDVMRPDLTIDQYRSLLERFHGFFVAWEESVGRMLPPDWKPLFDARRKTPSLEQDLRKLGRDDAAIRALPRCAALPQLNSLPDALGSMYVLEGGTLGGQVIAKQVRDVLKLDHTNGGAFFDGYGADTMRNWREFGALVEQSVSPNDHDAVIRSANETFECVRRWLSQ